MHRKQILFFDLDGTLTDSAPGILNSVTYALEKMGIPVEDRRALYRFIGPPLLDSFRDYYGMDSKRAEQAVAFYREYFSAGGLFEKIAYALPFVHAVEMEKALLNGSFALAAPHMGVVMLYSAGVTAAAVGCFLSQMKKQ